MLGVYCGEDVQFNLKYIAQKAHDGIWCQNAYIWRRSARNSWKNVTQPTYSHAGKINKKYSTSDFDRIRRTNPQ